MSLSGLTVRSANTGAAHRTFLALPYRLYAGNPKWVPPLRREDRRRWSPASNASLRDRWVCRFVAYRDGRPVGRVAAIEDPAFARAWEPKTGWFGFFECDDDAAAARALLRAGEEALYQRGLEAVIGPVNLTTHDETGILVGGFEARARLMAPYNPPYYDHLLTAAGYAPSHEYYAYRAPLVGDASPAMERLARAFGAGRSRRDLRIRPLDVKHWKDEARSIRTLYNRAFASVWGFVPITWEEFSPRARRFRQFAVPELAPIAELDGEPVGFAVALPDINTALSRTNGRLFPFGWLRVARTVPHIRAFQFIMLGVRPDCRGLGIGALLAFHVREEAKRLGAEYLELSLVQALNDPVRQVIGAFNCSIAKTYRMYRKAISGAGATTREAAA